MFSILEENRTNIWKKIIIFKYNGFYDFIIKWLNENINSGFVNEPDIDKIIIIDNIEDLVKELGEDNNE